MSKRFAAVLAAMFLAMFAIAGTAQAAIYGFEILNDDDGAGAGTVGHLHMEVTGAGSNVGFKFTNTASTGTIAQIYWAFDEGYGSTPFGFATDPFTSDPSHGVSFIVENGTLPGGVGLGFKDTYGVSMSGNVHTGIESGEWLIVSGSLGGGLDFDGLMAGINAGRIRVGMHVQSVGESESSISVVNKTPVPGAVWLLGTGLLGLLGLRRKPRG